MKDGAARIGISVMLAISAVCTSLLGVAAGENRAAWHIQTRWEEEAQMQEQEQTGILAGLTIAVDAGHGGYDGGAVGRTSNIPEKGINLDVAQRLEKMLGALGAQVIMTRTGDYALCDDNPPVRKKLQDMRRRAEMIEKNGAQMVLSIHMNEYARANQSGPQVFYREGCEAGRLLAQIMQEELIRGLLPRKERTAMAGDFYILGLGVPSVLIECGFLSNPEEEALLLTQEYRQKVAEAIAQGVLSWAAWTQEKPQPLERRTDL